MLTGSILIKGLILCILQPWRRDGLLLKLWLEEEVRKAFIGMNRESYIKSQIHLRILLHVLSI